MGEYVQILRASQQAMEKMANETQLHPAFGFDVRSAWQVSGRSVSGPGLSLQVAPCVGAEEAWLRNEAASECSL